MNDLDLLIELGDEVPLPDPATLAPVRARVLAGITRRRRRMILPGTIVATAAAAATIVALVPGHPATPPAARDHASTGAGTGVSSGSPAIRLLDRAAQAALAQPAVTPQPWQYVYLKDFDSSLGYTQMWTSVSETRDGLMESGGDPATTMRPCREAQCDPLGRYLAGFPTTAAAVPGYLTATFRSAVGDVDEFAVTEGPILNSAYLVPQQRAAFYIYLATIPGVTVQYGVRDAAGRQGTGLVWQTQAGKIMLIFDPRTYAYLGSKTWDTAGQFDSDAVITETLVNAPGQLPAG
jgi:hypothetical protein